MWTQILHSQLFYVLMLLVLFFILIIILKVLNRKSLGSSCLNQCFVSAPLGPELRSTAVLSPDQRSDTIVGPELRSTAVLSPDQRSDAALSSDSRNIRQGSVKINNCRNIKNNNNSYVCTLDDI